MSLGLLGLPWNPPSAACLCSGIQEWDKSFFWDKTTLKSLIGMQNWIMRMQSQGPMFSEASTYLADFKAMPVNCLLAGMLKANNLKETW